MIQLGRFYSSIAAAILTLGISSPPARPEPLASFSPATTLTEASLSIAPIRPTFNPFSTTPHLETAQATETPVEATQLISPRIGGQITTGPGIGYGSSFGSFYGFVPIAQTPGSTLAFAETRLNISTDKGRLGGNIALGYRNYLSDANLALGGYLAYDIRQTGNSTFNQIGAGLELLGDPWEVRLNSYFPVGNTRVLVSEQSSQSLAFSNPRFTGNILQLTQQTSTRRDRLQESALTGFDLEAGARLIAWDGGDLRGYLGTYVYGGAGVSPFAGFRTRLAVRPAPNLNVGISLQSDREFGTNFVLSFGANWGGHLARGKTRTESAIARLVDAIARQENIVATQRWETDFLLSQSEVQALNPTTGQPWFFRHVTLNGTGGDGTFGSPFNTVTTALNGIPSDGNQIVYIQGTGTIPGFTLPASVRLLSSGPVQTLNAQTAIQLPGSGSGNIPTINGTVTLQPDSVLNGFNLVVPSPTPPPSGTPTTPPATSLVPIILDGQNGSFSVQNVTATVSTANTPAISCSNVTGTVNLDLSGSNLTVENGNGIRCTNVTGTVTINAPTQNATLTVNSGQAGIFFQDNPGTVNLANLEITANGGAILEATDVGTVSITNSILNSTNAPGNGMTFNGVTGTFNLTNTTATIATPTGNGIEATNITGTLNLTANAGSQISNATGFGAQVQDSTGSFTLANFSITDSGNSGVRGSNVSNATLQGNTIARATNQGILWENSNGTLTVVNNIIQDTQGVLPAMPSLAAPPTGQGISLSEVTGTATIRSNQITGTTGFDGNLNINNLNDSYNPSGQGILIINTTGALNLTIEGDAATRDQVISGNREDAVLIALGDDPRNPLPPVAPTANITIQNNRIENNGELNLRGDGIGIVLEQNAQIGSLTVANNNITGNGDEGIDIRLGAISLAAIVGGQSFNSAAQINNATIGDNTISLPMGSTQQGINVELYQGTRFQASMTNNTLTNGSAGLQVRNYINIGNSTLIPLVADAAALASD
ncbi:MAG: right-handed parallel beta-helix repeat-containing protein, partial [Cyanobacteriota bacterium]|nr:right-handed parallel beta-helix repeat-containing protein [Cyanobacteriota bacterium]